MNPAAVRGDLSGFEPLYAEITSIAAEASKLLVRIRTGHADVPGRCASMQWLSHHLEHVSTAVSNFAANSIVQMAVLAGCIGWLALGGGEAALASALTIGGFILTQMVLAQQRRRDNALHLKIDELIVAMKGARNEVAGIESAAVEEIERLRSEREN